MRVRADNVRLARRPEATNVGKVVRPTEDRPEVAECGTCVIGPACGLNGALGQAAGAFLAALGRCTLADLVEGSRSHPPARRGGLGGTRNITIPSN